MNNPQRWLFSELEGGGVGVGRRRGWRRNPYPGANRMSNEKMKRRVFLITNINVIMVKEEG